MERVKVSILKPFNDWNGLPFNVGSEVYITLPEYEDYKKRYPDSIDITYLEDLEDSMDEVKVEILNDFDDMVGVPFIAGSQLYMSIPEFNEYKSKHPDSIRFVSLAEKRDRGRYKLDR